MSSSKVPAPSNATDLPPLRFFALRVGGPIDFVISGGINAIIAWLVFMSVERVEWVGMHSILMVSGPMFFILPLATTLMGYLSGVEQRRRGNFSPAWMEGTQWFAQAWRTGLVRAVVACPLGCAAIILAHNLAGDAMLGKWVYVAANGLLAGSLGYVLHSTAILQAERL